MYHVQKNKRNCIAAFVTTLMIILIGTILANVSTKNITKSVIDPNANDTFPTASPTASLTADKASASPRTHKVVVHTTTVAKSFVGTGNLNNVDFMLYGTKGSFSVRLNPFISGETYENEEFDVPKYITHYKDIGTLIELKVCTDESWPHDLDWCLGYVEIDGQKVEFDAWINDDHCEKRFI
jgi:hypothetical protein